MKSLNNLEMSSGKKMRPIPAKHSITKITPCFVEYLPITNSKILYARQRIPKTTNAVLYFL
jgi:hypothetical protein